MSPEKWAALAELLTQAVIVCFCILLLGWAIVEVLA
jgi:hypothetical protein